VTRPARLDLYPLSFVPEGDEVIIGRPDADSFGVFPADAAAVLRRLADGEELACVAAWYEAAYGEPADLDDFVATLDDLGFIRPPGEPVAAPRPVRGRRLGAIVLSRPALALYLAAAVAAVALIIAVPALRPSPSRLFFTRSLLLITAFSAAVTMSGALLHEGFHVLAGRRLGLASRLRLGRRLYFLVLETTLVGLMSVPFRRRVLPLCAGLVADSVVISAVIFAAAAGRLAGWPAWLIQALVAAAYLTLLRMLWQFMVFMETDLYQVVAGALRCPDLHAMSRAYLRGRAGRLLRRCPAPEPEGWTDRDRRIVRWYAPVVAAGGTVLVALAVIGAAPALAGFAVRLYQGIAAGRLGSPAFWNSFVIAAGLLLQAAVLLALRARDRRQARPSRFRPNAPDGAR
jgi:hypothetical protein